MSKDFWGAMTCVFLLSMFFFGWLAQQVETTSAIMTALASFFAWTVSDEMYDDFYP